MSDDLEPRIRDAFQQGSLPAAPTQLVDDLDAIVSAPVQRGRGRDRRAPLVLLVAAIAIAGLGVVAVAGGAVRPAPSTAITATAAPSTPLATPPAEDLRVEVRVRSVDGVAPTATEMATIVAVLQTRVAATGAVDPMVSITGTDTILVDLPGLTDAQPILRLVGGQGKVDVVPLGSTEASVGQTLDLVTYPPLLSDDWIASATVGVDQNLRPTIDLVLTPSAARAFATYTAANTGSYIAITVDGVVLSAPVINSPIADGSVQISGGGPDGFTRQEAASLVAILRSGVLPQVDVTGWSLGVKD